MSDTGEDPQHLSSQHELLETTQQLLERTLKDLEAKESECQLLRGQLAEATGLDAASHARLGDLQRALEERDHEVLRLKGVLAGLQDCEREGMANDTGGVSDPSAAVLIGALQGELTYIKEMHDEDTALTEEARSVTTSLLEKAWARCAELQDRVAEVEHEATLMAREAARGTEAKERLERQLDSLQAQWEQEEMLFSRRLAQVMREKALLIEERESEEISRVEEELNILTEERELMRSGNSTTEKQLAAKVEELTKKVSRLELELKEKDVDHLHQLAKKEDEVNDLEKTKTMVSAELKEKSRKVEELQRKSEEVEDMLAQTTNQLTTILGKGASPVVLEEKEREIASLAQRLAEREEEVARLGGEVERLGQQ
eukprot:Sspe_Gene.21121::Locus_7864_Transcript_1_1_Confidence_1.000_Length_1171::g.21121::m.21121